MVRIAEEKQTHGRQHFTKNQYGSSGVMKQRVKDGRAQRLLDAKKHSHHEDIEFNEK